MVLLHPPRHRPREFDDRTNLASARTNTRSMLDCCNCCNCCSSTSGGGGIGIIRDDRTMGWKSDAARTPISALPGHPTQQLEQRKCSHESPSQPPISAASASPDGPESSPDDDMRLRSGERGQRAALVVFLPEGGSWAAGASRSLAVACCRSVNGGKGSSRLPQPRVRRLFVLPRLTMAIS